jgi:hypothetical protein
LPLAEVARFSGLPEAQVAASALRGSGIEAVVLDQEPAQSGWREPYGRGGIRLCVPQADEAAAKALLASVAEAAPPAPPWGRTRESLAERLTPVRLVVIAIVFLAILAFALWGRL